MLPPILDSPVHARGHPLLEPLRVLQDLVDLAYDFLVGLGQRSSGPQSLLTDISSSHDKSTSDALRFEDPFPTQGGDAALAFSGLVNHPWAVKYEIQMLDQT